MKTRNEIFIAAPAESIFELASATERWPEILPHYRYVRVLERSGDRLRIAMGARNPAGIPVSWYAEQMNDPAAPQIFFRHLRGWTRGMIVFWRFIPATGGTLVAIDHELHSPIAPLAAAWFIEPIAGRTLGRIKQIAEERAR